MNKTIASIAITTLTLLAVPATQAKDKDKYHNKKHSGIHGFVPASHCKPHSCAPTLIFTKEIDRCYHTKSGFDSHGCFTHYKVLVITYASYYSNGMTRTFTRTFYV